MTLHYLNLATKLGWYTGSHPDFHFYDALDFIQAVKLKLTRHLSQGLQTLLHIHFRLLSDNSFLLVDGQASYMSIPLISLDE
jgi:hypothetical protein